MLKNLMLKRLWAQPEHYQSGAASLFIDDSKGQGARQKGWEHSLMCTAPQNDCYLGPILKLSMLSEILAFNHHPIQSRESRSWYKYGVQNTRWNNN